MLSYRDSTLRQHIGPRRERHLWLQAEQPILVVHTCTTAAPDLVRNRRVEQRSLVGFDGSVASGDHQAGRDAAPSKLPMRVFNDPKPHWMTYTRGTGLLAGLVQTMASLMPASWNQIVSWIRQIAALQAA